MPTPEELAYWDMVADAAVSGEVDVNYWKIAQIVRRVLKYDLWGAQVLEIGAGLPYVAVNLMNMVRFHYAGCEPSDRFREHAKMLFGLDLSISSADMIHYNDQSADFLFAFDVLEHIERKEMMKSCLEIGRVLKPGGLMFIHNPCEGNPKGHLKKFEPGFNFNDLQGLIDTAGLKLVEIEAYSIDIPVTKGNGHREYQWITLIKK